MNKEQVHHNGPDATGWHTLRIISGAGHFNRWMYHTIAPFLKGNILEIGSGTGNISAYAVHAGHTITLSDYDAGYCRLLKAQFERCKNVQAVLSINLQAPGFTGTYAPLKEQFDTIYLLNVIEHLEHDAAAIEHCSFLLKKGGNLVVLAPAYAYLYSRFDRELGHYRRYTTATLQRLFNPEAFTVIHQQYFNFFGLAGWFIFGKCLGKKMIGAGEMSLYNRLVPVCRLADRLVLHKAGLSAIVVGRKK